jgi:hydrogenase maturation protease
VTDLLVIGYGNDLRSDDGAGRVVADSVDERGLTGVTVRSVSQLTPELALEIAGRQRVVFVDASVDVTALRTERVVAGDRGNGVMTHHGEPASLLSLVETVGPVPDEAVVVSIPASNLGLGFDLSPATAGAVAEAIDLIVAMAGD